VESTFRTGTAISGRLMPGSYPTRNRTDSISALRIDICARYSGDGWWAVRFRVDDEQNRTLLDVAILFDQGKFWTPRITF
jgi:hypothetical protein